MLSFRRIEEGKGTNAMSLVAAADYTVSFREGYEPDIDWECRMAEFLARPTIPVLKKTKKSESETDIRPLIYDLKITDRKIRMKLSSGSAANLKPELVMEAFAAYAGFELHPFALAVNRDEVYANIGEEGTLKLVSLESLGEEIE